MRSNDSAMTARTLFATEITRLKRHVANAEARIAELDRGRRLARASEAVRSLRRSGIEAARPYESTLPEAEATLKRLRRRGGSVALEPANRNYETRIFGPDQVAVQGKLVGLMRRYH